MLFCNWTERALPSQQHIIDDKLIDFHQWVASRLDRPSRSDLLNMIRQCLESMEGAGVVRPLDILWSFSMSCLIDNIRWYDEVYITMCEIVAWVDLYRECMSYKKAGDGDGFDGPPRTLWEASMSLSNAKERANQSRNRLMIYGLIRNRAK